MTVNRAEFTDFPDLKYASNEAMNTLATNLSYCGEDIRVIEITSRFAYEGKSFVSANLMRTYASLQRRVVLVDADLRRSNLIQRHQVHFEAEKPHGLAQYLAGLCEKEDIIYETNIPGAYFVPIGRLVNSSLQLLTSSRLGELIDYLAEQYDVVLIDTPPAGTIVDAVEIAKHCDGALLVVSYGVGTKREVAEVSTAIAKSGCPVLGVTLNNVDMDNFYNKRYYYSNRYYGYKGRYGYGYYGTDDADKGGRK